MRGHRPNAREHNDENGGHSPSNFASRGLNTIQERIMNRRQSVESVSSVVTQRRRGASNVVTDEEQGRGGGGAAQQQQQAAPQAQEGERSRPSRQQQQPQQRRRTIGSDLWGLAIAHLPTPSSSQSPPSQAPTPPTNVISALDESSEALDHSIVVHSIPVPVPTFRRQDSGLPQPDDSFSQQQHPPRSSSTGRGGLSNRTGGFTSNNFNPSSTPPLTSGNGPRRRATIGEGIGGPPNLSRPQRAHGSSPTPSVTSEVVSVMSRRTSILFSHEDDDPDMWSRSDDDLTDASIHDDDDADTTTMMARGRRPSLVMDLRPSDHEAVCRMETSSLVSLSFRSNASFDSSDLAAGMFPVSSGSVATSYTADTCGPSLKRDLPHHWAAAAALGSADDLSMKSGTMSTRSGGIMRSGRRRGADGGSSIGGGSLSSNVVQTAVDGHMMGEGEQAHRTLLSLMSSTRTDRRSSMDRSVGSADTGQSGFWTALGGFPDGASTSGSECSSTFSDSSPLSRKKRKRQLRKVYVRKCARAMVTFVALAALSLSVLYFVSDEEEYSSMFEVLPLNSLFGNSHAEVEDEEDTIPEPGERMLPDADSDEGERQLPLRSGYNYQVVPKPRGFGTVTEQQRHARMERTAAMQQRTRIGMSNSRMYARLQDEAHRAAQEQEELKQRYTQAYSGVDTLTQDDMKWVLQQEDQHQQDYQQDQYYDY